MLSQETINQLADVLVERINAVNGYILNKIGGNIQTIASLSKTDVIRLSQVLKYGGSYEQIAKELAKLTNLNINEIYKLFEEVAKDNYQFAEQFYDYKNVDYIPWGQNIALQNKVRAIAKVTADTYKNISKTSTLGFLLKDNYGNKRFYNMRETYIKMIDEAVLSVQMGADTFQNQMYSKIKELGTGGMHIMYENGTTRRLDSAMRMNILDGISDMSNQLQKDFGKEFGSDGIEISVHLNSAPDHEPIQGHQFSNEQFDRLQNNLFFRDSNNNYFDAIPRAIGQWNCRHVIFSIVLGVSKPRYNEDELKAIAEENNRGIQIKGKTYTKYELTQVQRRLETQIRQAKELQILAKSSGNKMLINESQMKITKLTNTYKALTQYANLPNRIDRARVIGYKRTKTK